MSPAVAGMRGPDIPGFRWVRPLGQGGFADVFLYRQELPSRDVAIKVVRAQGDARGTKELHREADAMTLLSGHPSVVELHGVGTTADGVSRHGVLPGCRPPHPGSRATDVA